jgi:ABC-type multidrug transport system fused ATPase/permease subunit
MWNELYKRFFANPQGAAALIRRAVLEYGVRYWKRYALAVACMATMAACVSLSAYLIGHAINQVYVDRHFSGVAGVATLFIFLSILKGLTTYGQAVIMAGIGNEMTAENQYRLFNKLLQQDLAFFSNRHSSEFTARIAYGASSVSNVLGVLVGAFGRDLLSLIGLISVMVVLNPLMSLVAFLVMVPSVLIVRHLIKRVRAIALTQFSGGAAFLEALQESLQGMRVVKTLGLENDMRHRAHEAISNVERASNKMARVMNRSTPLMESLAGIAVALVLLYGGYRVLVVDVPPGEFISFIAAFLLAYEPGKRIARLNVELSGSLVGMKMLFELLDLPDKAQDIGKPALIVSQGRIAFDQVGFEYRPAQPVLRGISFAAEPGQMTALVGPSGGGKSTIFNLLLQLYEAKSGTITVDGQNIATVTKKSLREQIAYVGQDVFLFRGTVRQNIVYGRLDASEDDIIAAAQAAYAHEFISQFPLGYDTPVGEHGLQLSGGQRQRISAARALIRDAPIILLDEPTASLDGESERHVQEAVRKLSLGRTTLVIAHRLYTITHADMIYVIENGMVAESGKHEALLRRGDRYADFFNLQFRGKPEAKRMVTATAAE